MKYQTLINGVVISTLTVALAGNVAMARGKGGGKGPRVESGSDTTQTRPSRGGKRGGAGLFDRIDADGDGLIYEAEFVTAKTDKVSRHFLRMNSDDSLFLSQDEYEAHTYKHLDRLGIDEADMQTCMEEQLGADFEGKASWDELAAEADSDLDGLISEAELTAHAASKAAEKFVALDSSADSSLDEDEFSALQEEGSAIRAARRSCIDSLLEAGSI